MELKRPSVKERQKAWEELVEKERELLLRKGHDYTAGRADTDAYANFRIIADLLKGVPVTAFSVALVYALKHVLSVITFAKSGKQESGESLEGRFSDIRNYMFILNELVADHLEAFPVHGHRHGEKSVVDLSLEKAVVDLSLEEILDPYFPFRVDAAGEHVLNCGHTMHTLPYDDAPPEPQPEEIESLIEDDGSNFGACPQD